MEGTDACAALNPNSKKILAKVLKEARERIQVSDDELTEASRRRGLPAGCLRREFGGDSRCYVNGSIAHGDALTPLTDIDIGVVVPNPDGLYGPYGEGPGELQQRAADAIRRDLKAEFPNLRVIVGGRKWSVYVSFGDPVDPDQDDFSADVIVALDYLYGQGLWIPNYNSWDRSDPETHTQLVRDAVKSSKVNYSKTVRLLKHWARTHSKPLCSWNIKALGLACLAVELDQLEGLVAWFDYAINDLSWQETPDPAGVAGPIGLPGDRMELVEKLKKARDTLAEAIAYDESGYDVLAVEALARFFNDSEMLPHPDPADVTRQEAQRAFDLRRARSARTTAPLAGRVRHRTRARSWGAVSSSPARRARRAAGRREAARSAGGPSGPVKSAVRACPPLQSASLCARGMWRSIIAETSTPPPTYWYGLDPRWRLPLEADARAVFGDRLTATEEPGRRLRYRVTLDVHGPNDLVEVEVLFCASPLWDTYGLTARDYPRVWAERGRSSKHRMPDDALCLWFPADPKAWRWTSDKGLLDLLDLAVDHLIAEAHWRATGGRNGGVWLFDEAEHGFVQQAAA